MGNLAGWPYWKVISITGQSGAGTDYQVELEIGDSAGGDFHLEGHCTNFPQDIRITDDDGTTLLDHWVEDITADPIVVHVEVKDDLGSNRDIRVYYGKSGETTTSNGANTFIQYHGAATADFIDSLVVSVPFVLELKARRLSTTAGSYIGVSDTQVAYSSEAILIAPYTEGTYSDCVEGGTQAPDLYSIWTLNTWYNAKIVAISDSLVDFYIFDRTNKTGSETTYIPNGNLGLVLYEYSGSSLEQEWSFVRKYNSPEPAFSSAGAEQTPTVGAIMNQFQKANIGADLYNGVFA